MDEVTDADRLKALRKIQLLAGDWLGQHTSNFRPEYPIFEKIHRLAAGAQLASRGVTNQKAPEQK